MDTLITSLFALSALTVLVVLLVRFFSSRSSTDHRSNPQERSEREIERDRQTARIWLCVLAIVVGLLVLVYLLSR